MSMSMRNHTEGDGAYNERMNDQNAQILMELIREIGVNVPAVAVGPKKTTSLSSIALISNLEGHTQIGQVGQ